METKVLEIRDIATFIPVLCIDMNMIPGPSGNTDAWIAERYLLRRCGYPCDGSPNVSMTRLSADGTPCWNDPYGWTGRTFPVAHNYIIDHWHELKSGDVVDVEFILGETEKLKVSERISVPL